PTGDAEDFMTFWTRVEQGFLHVINRHRETGGNVLIVAHGNTIRNIVHELEPSMDEAVILDNASVTVLAYENGLFKLERLNDTSHFKKA
ncbi:histidine phosphatase family protein, partial [Listeria monocytogenes]|nr:histidine phosphatase family protein [Listeria monocytogenes]EKL4562847.1 histidine phosphatase family protein [Listeria monocytogenes]HDU0736235.1 histidine phosphatase family protein [Listeria monocytogenes]